MATLQELRGLFNDSDLQERVESALVIAVQAKLENVPTVQETVYAAYVFSDPTKEAKKAVMSVLGTNSELTTAQIMGASDASLQGAVDSILNNLVAAHAAVTPVVTPVVVEGV